MSMFSESLRAFLKPVVPFLDDPEVSEILINGPKEVWVEANIKETQVSRLKLGQRPTDLRQLQACAAIGQNFLMRAWDDCFARHNTPTAQILLTAGDFGRRRPLPPLTHSPAPPGFHASSCSSRIGTPFGWKHGPAPNFA